MIHVVGGGHLAVDSNRFRCADGSVAATARQVFAAVEPSPVVSPRVMKAAAPVDIRTASSVPVCQCVIERSGRHLMSR